jgi:ABC-type Zn uptake system ZnuABC Zn-binding protein ZnuA
MILMKVSLRVSIAAALVVSVMLGAACGGGGAGSGGDGDLVVVGTVSSIVDLIAQVGGDRVEAKSLVPTGRNTHDYQPRPSDARALEGADLFIDNGLGLNGTLLDFAQGNLPGETPTILLGNELPEDVKIAVGGGECHEAHSEAESAEGHCHGTINAHTWPDPKLAGSYVRMIAGALSEVDPDGAEIYQQNAKELRAQIDELHEAIAAATATIPEANRKLVVYHDAWAYFAKRYGLRMIGALQAANLAEPSASEVRAMIDQIKAEQVPAFFGSEVFPSDVMDAVAEQTGAKHIRGLSDDSLPGETGEPEHTYVGLMLNNAKLVVEALGGDAAALEAFENEGL